MKPVGSVLYSQEPGTGSYPEPDESSLRPLTFSVRSILIFSCDLFPGLPDGHIPSGLLENILYAFLISHVLLHVLFISSSCIR
jgi:hypothetical protein